MRGKHRPTNNDKTILWLSFHVRQTMSMTTCSFVDFILPLIQTRHYSMLDLKMTETKRRWCAKYIGSTVTVFITWSLLICLLLEIFWNVLMCIYAFTAVSNYKWCRQSNMCNHTSRPLLQSIQSTRPNQTICSGKDVKISEKKRL